MAEADLGRYLYVSRRIAQRHLDGQHSNDRSGYRVTGGELAPTAPGGASLGKANVERVEPPDTASRLAAQVTATLSGKTGSLSDLAAGTGMDFVRMRVDAHLMVLPVHGGWRIRYGSHVAAVAAAHTVAGAGRVLIALFGSMQNYLDRAGAPVGPDVPGRNLFGPNLGLPGDPRLLEGWNPSNLLGLYGLFEAVREPGDPVPYDDLVAAEAGWSPRRIADGAVEIVAGCHRPPPLQHVEILADLWIPPVRNVGSPGYGAAYDLVLVGAPVWIREVLDPSRNAPAPLLMDLLDGGRPGRFDTAIRDLAAAHEHAYVLDWQVEGLELAARRDATSGRSVTDQPEGANTDTQKEDVPNVLTTLQQQLDEALDHEAQMLNLVRGDVTARDVFPDMCRWFTAQADFHGLPVRRLYVHRRPTFWERLRRMRADWDENPLPTDIVGVVVTYRVSDHDRLLNQMLVTPSGQMYPVSVESVYEDGLAIAVYFDVDDDVADRGIRVQQLPPAVTHNRVRVAEQMMTLAFQWRTAPVGRASHQVTLAWPEHSTDDADDDA